MRHGEGLNKEQSSRNPQYWNTISCSHCGFVITNAENQVNFQSEQAKQEPVMKQNNFMIDNIIKIQHESYVNFFLLSLGGVDFQQFSKIFFNCLPLAILVLFSNHQIKLNTIQNTYYKHMALILLKIRILFINKKISFLHFL